MKPFTLIKLCLLPMLLFPLALAAKRISYTNIAFCVKQQLSRYSYTGQEKEQELKNRKEVYNYRARIYDAKLRKFLLPDKVKEQYVAYAYALNNPISLKDETGNCSKCKELISNALKENKNIKQIDQDVCVHEIKLLSLAEEELENVFSMIEKTKSAAAGANNEV